MKWHSPVMFLLALAACGRSAEKPVVTALPPVVAAEPLNDSGEVLVARRDMIATIEAEMRAYLAEKSPEEGVRRRQAFEALLAKLRSTPAKTAEELQSNIKAELVRLALEEWEETIPQVQASIPQRIKPEPHPGEKREATDADGSCSNDLVVDMSRFQVQEMEFKKKILQKIHDKQRLESLEISLSARVLVDRCDLLVDRYGTLAVCRISKDAPDVHKMADFEVACQRMRQEFGPLL